MFDGTHICIQLCLSGGYKSTSKSLENRKGFYFKDSWVVEEISLRFNFAVSPADWQNLNCYSYLYSYFFSKAKLFK